jgi:hypothetical protein
MNEGRTVFAQLMDQLPKYELDKCIARYDGNRRMRSFSTYEQFLTMAFAQLTYRESLRDITTCLHAVGPKLYHSGLRHPVARSTLADANEKRDWRIFADFAQVLIQQALTLYSDEPFGVELEKDAYALDSTTIDLCLSLFPWAKFRRHKAAIKLHTLLNLRGNFPTVIIVSTGKVHDVNILDQLNYEVGSFYVFDRAYIDFGRLHRLHTQRAFFVTRAKQNLKCRRRCSRPIDKSTGLRCDQTIILSGFYSRRDYTEVLRRISFRDPETKKWYVFLTNNFSEPALNIAQLSQQQRSGSVGDTVDAGQQVSLATQVIVVIEELLDRFQCFIGLLFQMIKNRLNRVSHFTFLGALQAIALDLLQLLNIFQTVHQCS